MVSSAKEQLLDVTEKLIRTRGYTAFSYAHLSEIIGIRKASIHYHFPTKGALGAAMIDGCLAKFEEDLQHILDSELKVGQRLRRYADIFVAGTSGDLLPLCGALAAEMYVLPREMQERVRYFFSVHLKWLNTVIIAGVAAKELRTDLDVEAASRLIVSTLEGASLVARATDNRSMIFSTVEHVITSLEDPRSNIEVFGEQDVAFDGPIAKETVQPRGSR